MIKIVSAFIVVFTFQFSTSAQTLDTPISENRSLAATIYRRLAGVRIPVDSPTLLEMESLLNQGKRIDAAKLAINQPEFLNITIKHMAAKISTRDELATAPLSDFVATFVGAVRDGKDARTLLTGDYFYTGPNPDLVDDVIEGNSHYQTLESDRADLSAVLIEQPRQLTLARGADGNATPTPLADAAGLLTTRAFTEAHAIAGTNRRMVHFAFRAFLCVDVAQWADTSLSDAWVGGDVDRAPAGEPATYMTSCKGCHAPMDALRGAFAHIDFDDDYLKHAATPNPFRRFPAASQAPTVASKFYRGSDEYPAGHKTIDASWVNTMQSGTNAEFFGWRGNMSGIGIKAFGRMLSSSEAFSRCMVKRAYRAACKREISTHEVEFVQRVATEFEKTYNIKNLFASVGSSPECLGK